MRSVTAPGLLLAAAALLAACEGDGGFQGQRLTPAEVGTVYQACTLTFTPGQAALPAADLLQRVVETNPPAGRPGPSVALSNEVPRFDLAYTRRGDNFIRQLAGEVRLGQSSVSLRLYTGGTPTGVPAELLLPGSLELAYSASPRRLTTGAGSPGYYVNRGDYARAAGITEADLQPRIFGTLNAVFAAGGCG